jgi:hypothetical protein
VKHLLPIALLTLLALAPATAGAQGGATGTYRECGQIAFTPNSDDMAADITAKGVTCKVAREFVRAAKGRPGARLRGYSCTKKELDTALPSWRYRCVKDGKVIRWTKT